MNKEDIIRMAREAGWIIRDDLHYMDHQAMQDALIERVERFATLVAAAERESWPAEMEAMERQVNILTDELARAKADEREACYELTDSRCQCGGLIKSRGNT